MRHRCPYVLKSAIRQSGLIDPRLVDDYKEAMLEGRWDFEGQGNTFLYWRDGDTIYVSEGHTRANAALEIGRRTGEWRYLHDLINHGTCIGGPPKSLNFGRLPTRGLWSHVLEFFGL